MAWNERAEVIGKAGIIESEFGGRTSKYKHSGKPIEILAQSSIKKLDFGSK